MQKFFCKKNEFQNQIDSRKFCLDDQNSAERFVQSSRMTMPYFMKPSWWKKVEKTYLLPRPKKYCFFFCKNWAKIKRNRKKHVFHGIFKKIEKKPVFHGIFKKIKKTRFSRNIQKKNRKNPVFRGIFKKNRKKHVFRGNSDKFMYYFFWKKTRFSREIWVKLKIKKTKKKTIPKKAFDLHSCTQCVLGS